jgi:hypothetical protein
VNFFGHACVASWYDRAPGFVLGAMLPDFFSMLRVKPGVIAEQSLARGIELHHRTDAAFHGSSQFLSLTRAARGALSEAGLARGPARAVAHIGVELLLDEVLASEQPARSAYLDALAHGQSHPEWLGLRDRVEAERLLALFALHAARGAPTTDGASSRVADRIARALGGRPRLALDANALALVGNWVVRARPDVVRYSSALIGELRERLNPAGIGRESAKPGQADSH